MMYTQGGAQRPPRDNGTASYVATVKQYAPIGKPPQNIIFPTADTEDTPLFRVRFFLRY